MRSGTVGDRNISVFLVKQSVESGPIECPPESRAKLQMNPQVISAVSDALTPY